MHDTLLAGVGDAGINMAWRIAERSRADAIAMHVESSNPQLNRYWKFHLAGSSSLADGSRLGTRTDIDALRKLFSRYSDVALVVGLGGSMSPEVTTLVDMARTSGAKVFVLATMPFRFEGRDRRQVAERALAEIRAKKVPVAVEENDSLLALGPNVKMLEAFKRMTETMASRWQFMRPAHH